MRDDVTFVERLHRDLRDVSWPEPTEIRVRARRRTRRTAGVVAAVVLAVTSATAVLAPRPGAPEPPTAPTSGDPAVGGRAEISTEALLAPSDLPVKSDEGLGDSGLDERVRVDDILRSCALDQGLPADQAISRYSRSQTLLGTFEAGTLVSRAPVISQDVYRLTTEAAGQVFTDLDRLVAACTAWRQRLPIQGEGKTVSATVVHQWTVTERDFAGDQAVLLRHTISVPLDAVTGKPVGFTPLPQITLVVRVGDLVTVLVPADPMLPFVPGSDVTDAQLRDVARAAARRMCSAANPGC
ncbi:MULTISPECIES: hypothetical protein [Micromonospora]|uniref:Uncharacterized protein n=1 Tax=Micromonospora sicca TaxID=2202420 RepID=A0A317DSK1_9ACTN|nr:MULTISPECIES: hypothetical protein [unclassified Micromonospora]MBM0227702.1 hypothetical protein [Micromonospora sp. ATA51]PWR17354.1 hypothetical protein DKT69_00685 [Micromonospora sp. 4G51]